MAVAAVVCSADSFSPGLKKQRACVPCVSGTCWYKQTRVNTYNTNLRVPCKPLPSETELLYMYTAPRLHITWRCSQSAAVPVAKPTLPSHLTDFCWLKCVAHRILNAGASRPDITPGMRCVGSCSCASSKAESLRLVLLVLLYLYCGNARLFVASRRDALCVLSLLLRLCYPHTVVPAGHYLKAPGQVAPCPQGEWKAGASANSSCTKCASGVNTPTEGSTSADACTGWLGGGCRRRW